jgi:hypothetical protein
MGNKSFVSFKPMCLSSQHMRLARPLTGSWRADPCAFVLDWFEMNIEHGLLDATSEHVSGEADHLL